MIRFLLAILAMLGSDPLRETTGAAPGYVDDSACAKCHPALAASYSQVAMSKAFYRPRADRFIEDFDAPPYYHAKSDQYFEMRRVGDRLVFRRYKLTADGAPIHVFETNVDWILGSGNHARTYIYRTPGGELFQLPISWYTATREWRMAPGYDRADHDGATRRVRHECMYCHNAYPDNVPADGQSYWRSQWFPPELPEGLGCQRCHGPGGNHIRAAIDGDAIENTIFRPKNTEVCYGCHMQPAVGMPAARIFGRDIYSFRPGQKVHEYAPPLDIVERDRPHGARFEINHHPYRLEQSACFTKSEGKLSCLTCHDPHRKVPVTERAAHYRAKCLSCHEKPHTITGDCVACHMPSRRTEDVVHVVMTDHFIRRTPGGPELLAPRDEFDPDPVRVTFLHPDRAPAGALGELYRLVPLVRARGGGDGRDVLRLEQLLGALKPAEVEPYVDLAMGQLRQRRYAQLEQTTKTILAKQPGHALATEWLGLARAGQTGKTEEAIPLLEAAIARDPHRYETEFNLGVLLYGRGRAKEAIEHYKRAVAGRPNLAAAWYRLGEAQLECGATLDAIDSFRRVLEIDPSHARANAALERSFAALRMTRMRRVTSPSPPAGTPTGSGNPGDR